jgi:sterol 3beta-glucosyltransferase
MNVTLLTAGSRGDVQPYVALGQGLRQAGHRVRLATHEGFRDLVEAHGLEFAPVASPSTALTSSPLWERWQISGDNFVHYVLALRQISYAAVDVLVAMLDDFWSACQGADLLISSTSGFAGPLLASQAGVPHCWALFQPMSPTRAFPHFMTPAWLRLGPRFNRWTYRLAEQIYWLIFRPAINRWITSRRQGRPLARPDPRTFLGASPTPVLYGISSRVVAPPPDWGARTRMCGFWVLDRPAAWRPPAGLVSFLAAGPPPVYVELGRIQVRPPERLLQIVLEALSATGQRGLLNLGDFPAERLCLPETVRAIGSTPHDWLFPQVAAVVYHGGGGTTAQALQAGVPSVGIPGFYDQPFWCRRLAALQVGAQPIAPRGLTARRLAQAIAMLVSDEGLRARARALGAALRAERGVDRALDFLRQAVDVCSGER